MTLHAGADMNATKGGFRPTRLLLLVTLPFAMAAGSSRVLLHAKSIGTTTKAKRVAPSPALPKPLSELVKKEAFYDWLKGADGPTFADDHGLPWERQCKVYIPACWTGEHTWLGIMAADGTQDMKLEGLPHDGYLFARIYLPPGKPHHKEKRYGFPADDDEFYLVVVPGTPDATYSIVGLKDKKADVITIGKFIYCDKDGPKPNAPSAGLKGCKTRHPDVQAALAALNRASVKTDSARALDALRRAMLHPQDATDVDDQAWVTCAHGCCIAMYD
jgi:hypothetical protein